jgi:hypothetical protein
VRERERERERERQRERDRERDRGERERKRAREREHNGSKCTDRCASVVMQVRLTDRNGKAKKRERNVNRQKREE